MSNDLGAAATVILVGLAGLSNNWTLRWLRGPRWKFWQRFNYGLFLLVLAHTVGYQTVLPRDPIMRPLVGLLALSILAAQLWGRSRYLNHTCAQSADKTDNVAYPSYPATHLPSPAAWRRRPPLLPLT